MGGQILSVEKHEELEMKDDFDGSLSPSEKYPLTRLFRHMEAFKGLRED